MSIISSLGVGSGIDIRSLVSDLVEAERRPATERLDRQQANYEAELSAYGRLKGALADFQASVQALNSTADFQGRSATSDNADLFTATALNTATEGRYSIEVTRLAQAHKLASIMQDADAVVGGSTGDSLEITAGTGRLSIDLSAGMNLADIRDAINWAANNTGVKAALVTGDNGQQGLVLTASATGYENRLQLAFGGASLESALGLATVNQDSSGNPLANLQDLDAQVVVDGYTANRGGNRVDDVISGVTLNLVGAEPGTATTLSVAQDRSKASSAVTAFVDSYNALSAVIRELSNYDATNGEHGTLLGDATLRNVENRLQRDLTSPVAGLTGATNTLSSIGVSASADGSLEIDSARLNQVIEGNFGDLTTFFAGPNGIASRIERTVSSYIADGGAVDARYDGVQASLHDITEQRETLDRRLLSLEQRYLAQFTAMDALVSQLTATSEFLTQQLSALPGFTREKN